MTVLSDLIILHRLKGKSTGQDVVNLYRATYLPIFERHVSLSEDELAKYSYVLERHLMHTMAVEYAQAIDAIVDAYVHLSYDETEEAISKLKSIMNI